MTQPNGLKSVYAHANLSRLLSLLSCLSWNWKERSSVKITERTHQSGSTTLGKCGPSGSMHRRFWKLRSKASPPHSRQDASSGDLLPRLQVRKWLDGSLRLRCSPKFGQVTKVYNR